MNMTTWIFIFIALLLCCKSQRNCLEYSEYEEARSLWESYGFNDYSMKFQWQCYCMDCYIANKGITVQSNVITDVLCIDSSYCEGLTNCTSGQTYLDSSYYSTIDGLFDKIRIGFENNYACVSATFDVTYGYPISGYLDIYSNAVDEEISWYISCIYIPNVYDTCNGFFPFDPDYENTIEYQEYTNAISLWNNSNITSYHMIIEPNCFCLCSGIKRIIYIIDNEIDRISCMSNDFDCNDRNCNSNDNNIESYSTIKGLFNNILNAIVLNYYDVSITYNNVLGYPEQGYIDMSQYMADEEFGWNIVCVAVDDGDVDFDNCDTLDDLTTSTNSPRTTRKKHGKNSKDSDENHHGRGRNNRGSHRGNWK